MKNVSILALDARYDVTYYLVVCGILCADVVGATSSEAVLFSDDLFQCSS